MLKAIFASVLLASSPALTSANPEVAPSDEVAPLSVDDLRGIVQVQSGTLCFSSGERTSGMNKICYYGCLSGTVAVTISAIDLCPLTIRY